ncbi:hypothetical protein GH146_00455 [archaeon]|nr:hypothetical protein [archaeon]
MVKLQKRFAYRYKDKKHYKHMITVPQSAISELGWSEGQQLIYMINNNTLIVKRVSDEKDDEK